MLVKENPCLLAKYNWLACFIRNNMNKTVLAFYKFLHLQNPQKEKEKLVSFLKDNATVGTIILSNEGINGMCSLDNDKAEKVKGFLRQNFMLKEPEFKENLANSNVFKKLSELIGYHKIINDDRIQHFKIKVSNKNSDKEENLKKILSKAKNKKILLSIDIEGDEYKVLYNIAKQSKFIHLLVIEFHHLDKKRTLFKKVLNNKLQLNITKFTNHSPKMAAFSLKTFRLFFCKMYENC